MVRWPGIDVLLKVYVAIFYEYMGAVLAVTIAVTRSLTLSIPGTVICERYISFSPPSQDRRTKFLPGSMSVSWIGKIVLLPLIFMERYPGTSELLNCSRMSTSVGMNCLLYN